MKRLASAVIALAIVIADQWSKSWITQSLVLGIRQPVAPPIVYLQYTTNDGVAWSLFRGHTTFFSLMAIGFVAGVVILGRHAMQRSRLVTVAVGLLLGGAVGNLIDRIRLGHVVDFISVHIGSWYVWPTFNVADSGITVGMVLLIYQMWRTEHLASSGPDIALNEEPEDGPRAAASAVDSQRSGQPTAASPAR